MPETFNHQTAAYRQQYASLQEQADALIAAATADARHPQAKADRQALLGRLAQLHDAYLQLLTEYRAEISQPEEFALEKRTETLAHLVAVLEGRDSL